MSNQDHGRIVNVEKEKSKVSSRTLTVKYADGYKETQIRVFEPLLLSMITMFLDKTKTHFELEHIYTPRTKKGFQTGENGYLVKFSSDTFSSTIPTKELK